MTEVFFGEGAGSGFYRDIGDMLDPIEARRFPHLGGDRFVCLDLAGDRCCMSMWKARQLVKILTEVIGDAPDAGPQLPDSIARQRSDSRPPRDPPDSTDQ